MQKKWEERFLLWYRRDTVCPWQEHGARAAAGPAAGAGLHGVAALPRTAAFQNVCPTSRSLL